MTKQKFKTSLTSISTRLLALTSAVLLFSASIMLPAVHADQFDDQIKSLQAQNSQSRAIVNSLQSQASSYQDAINKLQDQINALQGSINENQAKQADLQRQIDAAQVQLDEEKKTLGDDIHAIYVEGQISTLEMLASSKDLSDFVDKQQYRATVQDKIKADLDKVTKLKLQLQDQKTQVEQLIKELQSQQAQQVTAQNQQNLLLAFNADQQNQYNQQIQSNQAQIASLRAQQLAANRALGGVPVSGDPGHGGYPAKWDAPVPQDSTLDSWGMYNRECVSYTAWKVFQNYGYMPYWGGVGNANQWPGDAQSSGIPTGSTPKVGSVAISMGGAYGHAMWVEAVNGNMIYVSQYNYDLAGHYSEMWVNGSNFIYIYFGG